MMNVRVNRAVVSKIELSVCAKLSLHLNVWLAAIVAYEPACTPCFVLKLFGKLDEVAGTLLPDLDCGVSIFVTAIDKAFEDRPVRRAIIRSQGIAHN
jgi:hypothetical protein